MFVTEERIEMLKEIKATLAELNKAQLGCLGIIEEEKMTNKVEQLTDYIMLDADNASIDTKDNCNHVLVEIGAEQTNVFNELSSRKGLGFFIDRLYFCPNCLRRFAGINTDTDNRQIVDLIDFSKSLHRCSNSLEIKPLDENYSIMAVDKPVINKDQSYLSILYLRAFAAGVKADELAHQMRRYYDEDNKKKEELSKRMLMETKKINLGI